MEAWAASEEAYRPNIADAAHGELGRGKGDYAEEITRKGARRLITLPMDIAELRKNSSLLTEAFKLAMPSEARRCGAYTAF